MKRNQEEPEKFNRKKAERAIKRSIALIVFAFLFALFSSMLSACRRTEPKVYEVKTSGVMYQTSENKKRLKEPVNTETVYFVVGGEEQ
jgi:hypothetical protein